jgi:hypothetical protein
MEVTDGFKGSEQQQQQQQQQNVVAPKCNHLH